jgi:hypothetical protein
MAAFCYIAAMREVLPQLSLKLSAQAIEEFRVIWKSECHEEISVAEAEAQKRGSELLRLFAILAREVPTPAGEVSGDKNLA